MGQESRMESMDRSQSSYWHQALVVGLIIFIQLQSSYMPGLVVIKLALCTLDAAKVYQSPLQNSIVLLRGQTVAQSLKMSTVNTLRIRKQVRKKRDYMHLVAVLEE